MEGERNYTFWGQLTNHPKYIGVQMTRYERSKPSVAVLSSISPADNFKGIVKTAGIVEIYGEDPIIKILGPVG